MGDLNCLQCFDKSKILASDLFSISCKNCFQEFKNFDEILAHLSSLQDLSLKCLNETFDEFLKSEGALAFPENQNVIKQEQEEAQDEVPIKLEEKGQDVDLEEEEQLLDLDIPMLDLEEAHQDAEEVVYLNDIEMNEKLENTELAAPSKKKGEPVKYLKKGCAIPANAELFPCPHCNKVIQNRANFNRHINSHKIRKPVIIKVKKPAIKKPRSYLSQQFLGNSKPSEPPGKSLSKRLGNVFVINEGFLLQIILLSLPLLNMNVLFVDNCAMIETLS